MKSMFISGLLVAVCIAFLGAAFPPGGPFFSTLPKAKTPTVQDDVEFLEAKSLRDNFHPEILKASRKAIGKTITFDNDGVQQSVDWTAGKHFKLRRSLIMPGVRKQVREMALMQMASTGGIDKIPMADGGSGQPRVDWSQLADFLERVLPLVLDFIEALLEIISKIAVSLPDIQIDPHFERRFSLAA